MAERIAAALDGDERLLVEAGTGTGKTLAYLIPALLSGRKRRRQHGHAHAPGSDRAPRHPAAARDPRSHGRARRPLTWAVMKGVAELRRAGAASPSASRQRSLLPTPELDRALVDWVERDRDRRSRRGRRGSPTTRRCGATSRPRPTTRIGAALPVLRALLRHAGAPPRRATRSSSSSTTTSTSPTARCAPARPGAQVLPEHDVVIFDEAHQLEDVATEHFGARVSTQRLSQLVRDLARARRDQRRARDVGDGRASRAPRGAARGRAARRAARARAPGRVRGARAAAREPARRRPRARARYHDLDGVLEEISHLARRRDRRRPRGGSPARELAGLGRRANALRDDLAALAEQRGKSSVYWGEPRRAT